MNRHLIAALFGACAFGAAARAEPWRPPPGAVQLPLWPGPPPGARPDGPAEEVQAVPAEAKDWLVAGMPWTKVLNVSRPTITVYPPKEAGTGAAVVVFPGGGFNILAIDLEGTEVCDWLTSVGVACVLLKYRVPGSGPRWEGKRRVMPEKPAALQDAQRALSLVRHRAAEWKLDPRKIGVIGFSAGGYLAAAVSTYDKRAYPAVDEADRHSPRPDFAITLYPGHLAANYRDDMSRLNPRIRVTKGTPPTLMIHAQDDPVDPVEYSLLYHAALKKANVPVELHLYAEGKHAFGLRRTEQPITRWPELAQSWLKAIGMIPERRLP